MSGRAWVFMVALLCACDDDESSNLPLDAGTIDATSDAGDRDGGAPDAPVSDALAADAGPAIGLQACMALGQAAQQKVAQAIKGAQADLSCASDDDCVFVGTPTACTFSCGALFNQQGLAKALPIIAAIATESCPEFQRQGCVVLQPPCTPPSPVACVAGTCSFFPPAKWTSFAVIASHGPSVSASPACAAGEDCTVWALAPDATLTKNVHGLTSKAALTPADFATVDGILRSLTFRTTEMAGFGCGPRPPQGGFAFSLGRDGTSVSGFDVSGCVAAGADNDPARLVKVLTAY
jgi:hypothetical protein